MRLSHYPAVCCTPRASCASPHSLPLPGHRLPSSRTRAEAGTAGGAVPRHRQISRPVCDAHRRWGRNPRQFLPAGTAPNETLCLLARSAAKRAGPAAAESPCRGQSYAAGRDPPRWSCCAEPVSQFGASLFWRSLFRNYCLLLVRSNR